VVVATEDGTEVRLAKDFCYSVLEWCADDYDDRRRDVVYESPADKLKTAIIKLGEVVSP
jgi:hypothetical protein